MSGRIIIILAFIVLTPGVSFSAAGDLDYTFGGTGIVTYSVASESLGHAVALQEDGKIVIAGEIWKDSGWNVLVLRYNVDGTLDKTFSGDGVAEFDSGHWDYIHGIAIQADGKIVVVGESYYPNYDSSNLMVVRFKPNGAIDGTFGKGGMVTYCCGGIAYGVAIQPDQKIVVVGDSSYSLLVLRYDSSGSLDPDFGAGGAVEYDTDYFDFARGVAIQNDGKIVVTGGDYTVVTLRLNSSGSLDNTFGSAGVASYYGASGYSVGTQSDDKIVVAGASSVLRYNSDGTLDNTFGSGGVVTITGTASAVTIQSDGKIVVAAYKNGVALISRYTTIGTLDSSFSGDGTVKLRTSGYLSVDAATAALDGKIIVVGSNNYMTGPFVHNDVITVRIIAIPSAIITPNGGEVISAGELYQVTWEAPVKATKFRLKYSMDGGANWTAAHNDYLPGRSYAWPVPVPANNMRNCLLKLAAYDDSLAQIGGDKSDTPFTIEVLRLISPNGDESLTSGEQRTIMWATSPYAHPVDRLILSYTLNNGLTWRKIDTTDDPSNDGTFDWPVPEVAKEKTKCKLKVVLKDSSGKTLGSDVSDSGFSIKPAP